MGKGPKGFTAVEENKTGAPRTELREGDLFLREMNGKLYHAGIYCGNNEVIDFTGSSRESMRLHIIRGALDNKSRVSVHVSHVEHRDSNTF